MNNSTTVDPSRWDEVGTVPGRDGCTICGYRSLGGMEDVDIYVW